MEHVKDCIVTRAEHEALRAFVDKDLNDACNRRAQLALATVIGMLKAKRDAIAGTECNGDPIVTKTKWGKFELIQSIIDEVETIKGGF